MHGPLPRAHPGGAHPLRSVVVEINERGRKEPAAKTNLREPGYSIEDPVLPCRTVIGSSCAYGNTSQRNVHQGSITRVHGPLSRCGRSSGIKPVVGRRPLRTYALGS